MSPSTLSPWRSIRVLYGFCWPSAVRYLDIIGQNEVDISYLARPKVPVNFSHQRALEGLPISMCSFEDDYPPSQNAYCTGWISNTGEDHRLVHSICQNGGMGAARTHLTATAVDSRVGETHRWGTLWEYPLDTNVFDYSFYSMSSRVCVTTEDGIHTID